MLPLTTKQQQRQRGASSPRHAGSLLLCVNYLLLEFAVTFQSEMQYTAVSNQTKSCVFYILKRFPNSPYRSTQFVRVPWLWYTSREVSFLAVRFTLLHNEGEFVPGIQRLLRWRGHSVPGRSQNFFLSRPTRAKFLRSVLGKLRIARGNAF